jgi:hypothetical protein
MSAFHYKDGCPNPRFERLIQQYNTLGFDHTDGGEFDEGADLRRRYRDGLLTPAEESTLRKIGFNLTFEGTCPLLLFNINALSEHSLCLLVHYRKPIGESQVHEDTLGGRLLGTGIESGDQQGQNELYSRR